MALLRMHRNDLRNRTIRRERASAIYSVKFMNCVWVVWHENLKEPVFTSEYKRAAEHELRRLIEA